MALKQTQADMKAISTNHIAEFETDSEPEQESDLEQLAIGILLNTKSNNDWLDSLLQVYSVTISKFPTIGDLPI